MGRDRDGSVPSNFLTPEIRKLAKNLVYFSLHRWVLLWELRQTFLYLVISASNFGVLLPKISEPKNLVITRRARL